MTWHREELLLIHAETKATTKRHETEFTNQRSGLKSSFAKELERSHTAAEKQRKAEAERTINDLNGAHLRALEEMRYEEERTGQKLQYCEHQLSSLQRDMELKAIQLTEWELHLHELEEKM